MKNYKVIATMDFTLNDIKKIDFTKKEKYNGTWIYKNDEFLCDKEIYEYLNGNNPNKIKVIDLVEIFKKIIPSNEENKQKNKKENKKK